MAWSGQSFSSRLLSVFILKVNRRTQRRNLRTYIEGPSSVVVYSTAPYTVATRCINARFVFCFFLFPRARSAGLLFHFFFLLGKESDVFPMPAGDEGLGEESVEWPVDFAAGVMWARQVSIAFV